MKYSKSIWLRFALFLAVMPLLTVACGSRGAADERASTGIPVAEEFKSFYQQHGGATVFGSPLTTLFHYPAEHKLVQYFQTLRLEFDADTQSTSVTPLGAFFWADRPVVAEAIVEGEFQEFYQRFGGDVILGAPLSNQMVEGERWVQYFQNGMLQWYPENPPMARVRVAELGLVHYWRSGAAQAYQASTRGQLGLSLDASITRLEVSGVLSAPILFSGESQTLHLDVTTPEGYPASAQTVQIILLFNDGEQAVVAGRTDQHGTLRLVLPSIPARPDQLVKVQVSVLGNSGRILGQEQLSYKAWW